MESFLCIYTTILDLFTRLRLLLECLRLSGLYLLVCTHARVCEELLSGFLSFCRNSNEQRDVPPFVGVGGVACTPEECSGAIDLPPPSPTSLPSLRLPPSSLLQQWNIWAAAARLQSPHS